MSRKAPVRMHRTWTTEQKIRIIRELIEARKYNVNGHRTGALTEIYDKYNIQPGQVWTSWRRDLRKLNLWDEEKQAPK